MPYNFEAEIEEAEKEGGSGLRRKLEETLRKNREYANELSALRAQSLIGSEGFDLVKPEDLQGVVDPEEMRAKAKQLQEERAAEQESLLRATLARKGLEGEALDQAVADLLGVGESQTQDGAFGRVNETLKAGGAAAPIVNPQELHGVAAIEHGLEQRERRAGLKL